MRCSVQKRREENGFFYRHRSTDYVNLRKTKEIKDRKQNNSKQRLIPSDSKYKAFGTCRCIRENALKVVNHRGQLGYLQSELVDLLWPLYVDISVLVIFFFFVKARYNHFPFFEVCRLAQGTNF